jgi:isocitrate/isopropylmalate dehydrogenase
VASSGNIGLDAAVFEPVHGSAPTLVGTGQANPIATFLAASMMLDHLHESEHANLLRTAIESCIAEGQVTPDLGGTLTTNQVTEKVIQKL